jgi:hypothetical protein
MASDKSWLLFLGVFSLVGLACSGIAYYIWHQSRSLKADGIQTTGVVIDHIQGWRDSHHRSNTWAVVVQYTDWQHTTRIYRSDMYTDPVLFGIGETVRLWYRKETPDKVLLDGASSWLLPAILGGFGLVFSLIGLPGLLKHLFRFLIA